MSQIRNYWKINQPEELAHQTENGKSCAALSPGLPFRFATKYGHPKMSMSSKKQELPAYDPRGIKIFAG